MGTLIRFLISLLVLAAMVAHGYIWLATEEIHPCRAALVRLGPHQADGNLANSNLADSNLALQFRGPDRNLDTIVECYVVAIDGVPDMPAAMPIDAPAPPVQ